METKYVRVPFEVELAKEISNGSKDGKIVTREGYSARVVCWDKKDKDFPIVCLVNDDLEECIKTYTIQGVWNIDPNCTIRKHDLFLEIPEYMTFKDGDVYTTLRGSIGIYNSSYKSESGTIPFYVGMRNDGELIFRPNNNYAGFGNITESMLSTEAEKQKLIEALKASKDPRAKECLKKLGIDAKQECEFKPFDKVLARFSLYSEWCAVVFSHKNEYGQYICCGIAYNHCIPYEGNEHLLGTNKSE